MRKDGAPAESFLENMYVPFLLEAVLSLKQQKQFYEDYWWFVHNHQPEYFDPKKGKMIGAYATAPQDNASVLARFEDYLLRLVNHSAQQVRSRYEDFPLDIVLAILKRAFL